MTVTRTEMARTTSTSNSKTLSVPVTAACGVGEQLSIKINTPTSNAITTVTVTDSQSNTYVTQVFQNTTKSSRVVSIATSVLTHALTTSDTLTVTTDVFVSIWQVLGHTFGLIGVIDGSATETSDSGAGTSGTPTNTASAAARENHQCVEAVFANTNTTHTLAVTTAGFTEDTEITPVGTGSTQVHMHVVYGEVSASGTRAVAGTYTTAAAWGGGIVAFAADAPVTITFTKTVTVG